jgi:hypothetical protein
MLHKPKELTMLKRLYLIWYASEVINHQAGLWRFSYQVVKDEPYDIIKNCFIRVNNICFGD